MSKSQLIGKAKELHVAALLVAKHLHVYFPLVDHGFDLVVSSKDGRHFLPVQVKYEATRTGFNLDRADVARFRACDVVLAFGSGTDTVEGFHFIPFADWLEKSEDRNRGDGKIVVYLTRHGEWARQYVGEAGIRRAFAGVLNADAAR